jgi:hypothetical protein
MILGLPSVRESQADHSAKVAAAIAAEEAKPTGDLCLICDQPITVGRQERVGKHPTRTCSAHCAAIYRSSSKNRRRT